MTAIVARLARDRTPLVLDGGLGSMLIARGLERGTPPERWNLERPSDVAAVHQAYVEAGSEAVHTNTFGANPIRLRAFGLEEHLERINRTAVEHARGANAKLVIADVGPTGEYLPPVGKANEGAWREAFVAQGRVLADSGIDAFHIETMSDAREAKVALAALQEVAPAIPAFVSLTFDRKKRGFYTVMGNPLGASLVELARAGAAAVGANCSITSPDMVALVEEALAALAAAGLATPLVVQPNAGQPKLTGELVVYEQSPEQFAADAAAMARAGARMVGGCCGTDPRFIAALRAELDRGES